MVGGKESYIQIIYIWYHKTAGKVERGVFFFPHYLLAIHQRGDFLIKRRKCHYCDFGRKPCERRVEEKMQ